MATDKLIGFAGPNAPAEADLYKCIHCGLCLQSCPTYVETGLETESPRGRIAFMKAVHEKRLGLSDRVVEHIDLCLQCRACEDVCPSGVPFGRVMEATRAQIVANRPMGRRGRLARWLVFRVLLPRLGLVRALAWSLKSYQRLGVQWAVREFRVLKPLQALDHLEQQLPHLPKFFRGPGSQVVPAVGDKTHRVAMLSGCVMPLVYGPVNEATVRVLARNGCEVVVPASQGCCGSLSVHSGERESAKALARKNIDVFLEANVDSVIVNSAGCSSVMKEYGELLKDDPDYAEKAHRVGGMVRDVNEYLASLPLRPPLGQVQARVTYQDSCHLAHAQRITDAPRQLMNAIPGLKLVEMESSDMCCGAAGVYNITHSEMSERILDSKMEHACATNPDIIATANPGCMLQLEMGLRGRGLKKRVAHVVELLDEAYSKE